VWQSEYAKFPNTDVDVVQEFSKLFEANKNESFMLRLSPYSLGDEFDYKQIIGTVTYKRIIIKEVEEVKFLFCVSLRCSRKLRKKLDVIFSKDMYYLSIVATWRSDKGSKVFSDLAVQYFYLNMKSGDVDVGYKI